MSQITSNNIEESHLSFVACRYLTSPERDAISSKFCQLYCCNYVCTGGQEEDTQGLSLSSKKRGSCFQRSKLKFNLEESQNEKNATEFNLFSCWQQPNQRLLESVGVDKRIVTMFKLTQLISTTYNLRNAKKQTIPSSQYFIITCFPKSMPKQQPFQ